MYVFAWISPHRKLYAEREDWKDVQPIPQDDGPHPACAIAYSDIC